MSQRLSPTSSLSSQAIIEEESNKQVKNRNKFLHVLPTIKIYKQKKKTHLQPSNNEEEEEEEEDNDDEDDEVAEITGMRRRHSTLEEVTFPLSKSSSSLNIFERSVQEQATMSTISRISSFGQVLQHSTSLSLPPIQAAATGSSPLLSSCNSMSKIPDHLTSESFVPTCLDATTEALIHDNLEDLEVIQSTNANLADVLEQTYCNNQRRKSRSIPLSRIHSPTMSPIGTSLSNRSPPPTLHSRSNSLSHRSISEEIDYSDHKRLNFCSYADLLFDEFENGEEDYPLDSIDVQLTRSATDSNFPMSSVCRKNSSIQILPALSLTKTGSIREVDY